MPQRCTVAHPLAKFLKDKDLSHHAFAELSGVERATITKVLSGKRKRFSVEAAKKIVAATSGAVSLEAALGLKQRRAV